ncbi:MAG: hypothetical protein ACQET1_07920 [Gemmatimonadota bacterium]
MQILPIDVTAIVAVVMGISIVLVPVIGLTARFALKPTVEALSRVFESKGTEESVQMLEQRLSLMEQQLDAMESSLRRIEETSRFDAQLRAESEPAPKELQG